jgi:probable phosphoglycerate mutase
MVKMKLAFKIFFFFISFSTLCFSDESVLLLIRHGQTDWNIEDRAQGLTNNPLNKKGIAQAEDLAGKIASTYSDITAIYASDLDRAFMTAQITGNRLHLPVNKREQLRERNNGAAEGLTTEEEQILYGASEKMLGQLYPDYRQRWDHTSIPDAESYNELLKRVKSELIDIATKHLGEQVAVFAHGEILGIFVSDLLGKEKPLHLPNCSIIKILYLPEDSTCPFKFIAIDEPSLTEEL